MSPETSEEVLKFWFPQNLSDDHAVMVRQFEWWFRSGADIAVQRRNLMAKHLGQHAVVIGGSMAGLMTARVLGLFRAGHCART